MRNVAVFGARGYLGRQLAVHFGRRGVACSAFDLPECDVTDAAFWRRFDPTAFDAVLFFAGLTGTERGFAESAAYLSVNEGGLLRLLDRLAPLGAAAPKLVFPSTRLVYRGSESPLDEDATKETKTVYAVNKLACEGYVAAYANRFGLRAAVCRICVPYGSLDDSDASSYGTIGFFMRQVSEGRPVELFGGGEVRRTFTHVADVCRAAELLADSDLEGVYNVGGHAHSLREVAESLAGSAAGVRSVAWPPAAERLESGSTVFDSAKLDAAWLARRGTPMTYRDVLSITEALR